MDRNVKPPCSLKRTETSRLCFPNITLRCKNSSSTNGSDTTPPMPFSEVTAVIYTTVFVVGFLGNALVIYVVARYTKMKTVTNMYIMNLAVADELYIMGIPLMGTNSALSFWPFGNFLCKVSMTADGMCQFSSTVSSRTNSTRALRKCFALTKR
uniref:G-protein coupled receptors family 1 profile domain-containing protein n=1 Tax=Poecilia reticulata TaxID=8081 RepID=A0A3P9MVA5_POERE